MSYTPPLGNAVNFNFTEAYTPPLGNAVDFSFGDSAVEHEITVSADLPSVESDIVILSGSIVTIVVAGEAPAVGSNIYISWGADAPSASVVASSTADSNGGMRWGVGSLADNEKHIPFDSMTKINTSTLSEWDKQEEKNTEPLMGFGVIPQKYAYASSHWGLFDLHQDKVSAVANKYIPPLNNSKSLLWALFSQAIDRGLSEPWIVPPAKDAVSEYLYQRVDLWEEKRIWDTRDYTPPPGNAVNFNFTDNGYVADPLNVNFEWGSISPYGNQPIKPTDPFLSIGHNVPSKTEESRDVVWGEGSWTRPDPDYESNPSWTVEPEEAAERPPQPAIREVYIFMPSLTLYRTPDGTEFEAVDVSWSTDQDSWGWIFSATLKRSEDIALLRPDGNGPKEIACEINGHVFSGVVEGYGLSRLFGQTSYTIKGRSLSAWLSEPYAPIRSKAIASPYTASQLAEQELIYTDWVLDWQAPDWSIPANAYSYDSLDPIAAIKRLADAVGAVVHTHQSSKTIIVKPRYPVSPHKWTDPATALDAILPIEMIQQSGSEYSRLPLYNRAISAGGAEGGVIVTLTRDGTAGDELAPLVVDSLITAQTAGYERGRNEIAKGGSWETMRIETLLTDSGVAPGLMLPGNLVEVQDTTETYPVQINSTGVKAAWGDNGLSIRQSLSADRSLSNE